MYRNKANLMNKLVYDGSSVSVDLIRCVYTIGNVLSALDMFDSLKYVTNLNTATFNVTVFNWKQ